MSVFSTIEDDIDKAAAYAEPAIAALELAQSMTGVGGAAADVALKAIDAILKTAIGGIAGNVDPAQILADLQKLQSTTVSDDAAADAALAGRFPQAGG